MKKRIVFFILIIILLIIGFITFYFSSINETLINTSKLTLQSVAQRAINSSIKDISYSDVIYNQLIDIKYNEGGQITLIQIKSYEANKICNKIIEKTENNLEILGDKGINIKGGLFTNIPILGGIGKNYKFNFNQIGSVNCVYHSKFSSVGINQNLHRLYVDINTKIGIVFPFHTEVVDIKQEVLLCENIIVGEVPYTYLQSTELDSLLNLVPS